MKKRKFLILICGPSGSGKTTISNYIKEKLSPELKCAIFSQDNFYLTNDKIPKINGKNNYDHPKSFDWTKTKKTINDILNNKKVQLKIYDYKQSKYTNKKFNIDNNYDVFILEGIYALFDKELNKKADLKLYIDTELDECFIRRLQRDVKNRNRSLDSIINQWREVVKPMYNKHIWNLRLEADLIIPSPCDYEVTLSMLDSGIKGKFIKNNGK